MHTAVPDASIESPSEDHVNGVYIWGIAAVAALGGLLFGYDWVVIGGAKPFYETYFHLHTANLIGWANSCALVGCFTGSLCAGALNNRAGRKTLLALAAVLFALSSVATGWSHSFISFVSWRVVGGIAIGLASNVSPTYIAEISPAKWRGRLVSLNQLALVTGILGAQVVDWLIARPIPPGLSSSALEASWNVQYAWRWMFTVVALPACVLLVSLAAIPESPRWLAARGKEKRAYEVLRRIGDEKYADDELGRIEGAIRRERTEGANWSDLLAPGLRKALLIGVVLAILQQWSGINIIFNYAEEIYRSAGYGVNEILFNIVVTGSINLIFTLVAMACVDRLGRRALMMWGCVGVSVAHMLAALSYWSGLRGPAVLVVTLVAIACYAVSLAPVTWVLITEIFPNRIRGKAVSVAVSALWAAAFILTYTFPVLNRRVGTGGSFFLYGVICFAGAVFVYALVPETRGRSLEQVEEALSASSG